MVLEEAGKEAFHEKNFPPQGSQEPDNEAHVSCLDRMSQERAFSSAPEMHIQTLPSTEDRDTCASLSQSHMEEALQIS